ncbi:MAG: hypothetical protein ACRDI1_09875 [Actinomycetota bacterium]
MKRKILIGLAVLALASAACAQETDTGGGDGNGDGDGNGATAADVTVTLSDYEIDPSVDSAAAGSVTFEARNDGPQPHELMAIATDLAPDQLPKEGAVVDEDAEGLEVAGEIEEFPSGETQTGTFELEAGSYVLICNVATHYDLGMRVAFTVE